MFGLLKKSYFSEEGIPIGGPLDSNPSAGIFNTGPGEKQA